MTGGTALPPGQRRAALRRFGLPQFARRQAIVTVPPAVMVSGPSGRTAELAMKPLLEGVGRRDQTSALHCVTTWSALDLHWGGVTFRDVHDAAAELVPSAASARWVSFIGADGYSACMFLEDALSADVMIADELGVYRSPPSMAHQSVLSHRTTTATRTSNTWSPSATELRTALGRRDLWHTPAAGSCSRSAVSCCPGTCGAGYGEPANPPSGLGSHFTAPGSPRSSSLKAPDSRQISVLVSALRRDRESRYARRLATARSAVAVSPPSRCSALNGSSELAGGSEPHRPGPCEPSNR
jgi:Oxidoreductase molybdopterin binding domain